MSYRITYLLYFLVFDTLQGAVQVSPIFPPLGTVMVYHQDRLDIRNVFPDGVPENVIAFRGQDIPLFDTNGRPIRQSNGWLPEFTSQEVEPGEGFEQEMLPPQYVIENDQAGYEISVGNHERKFFAIETPQGIANETERSRRTVFSPDDRVQVEEGSYPGSAVGRFFHDGYYCTTSIIETRFDASLQQLALTNGHCMQMGLDAGAIGIRSSLDNAYFSFPGGEAQWTSMFINLDYAGGRQGGDWLMVSMNKRFQDRFGAFKISDMLSADMQMPFNLRMIGFSGDCCQTHAHDQSDCAIVTIPDETMGIHTCDMQGGASGSPLFTCLHGGCEIALLNNAHWAPHRMPIEEFDVDRYWIGGNIGQLPQTGYHGVWHAYQQRNDTTSGIIDEVKSSWWQPLALTAAGVGGVLIVSGVVAAIWKYYKSSASVKDFTLELPSYKENWSPTLNEVVVQQEDYLLDGDFVEVDL